MDQENKENSMDQAPQLPQKNTKLPESADNGLDVFKKQLYVNQTNIELDEMEKIFVNECTQIKLVSNIGEMAGSYTEKAFQPEYTHQIWNEDEEVAGYKDLIIDIFLTSGSLKTYVEIEYEKKVKGATDLIEPLDKTFLAGFSTKKKEFTEWLAEENKFKPIGKLVSTYKLEDNNEYCIYESGIHDKGFTEYKERMQVFCMFMIETASYVEDSEYWRYYMLFQKDASGTYTFMGMLSKYIFHFNLHKSRHRVSQMVILPPFQRKGHGLKLIDAVYDVIIKDEGCYQMTVEDPSPEFQALRDLQDISLITEKKYFEFMSKKIDAEELKNLQLDEELLDKIKKELKIKKKQILRAFEIIILMNLDKGNQEVQKIYKESIIKRIKKEIEGNERKNTPFIYLDGETVTISKSDAQKIKQFENPQENDYEKLCLDQIENYKKIIKKRFNISI